VENSLRDSADDREHEPGAEQAIRQIA